MIYNKKNNFIYTIEDVKEISGHFGFSELTGRLLLSRGLNIQDIDKLLQVSPIEDFPFFEIPNIEQAAQRIEDAMMSGEKIAVYGDYDADGICGTSIIINSFKRYGYDNVMYYIPNRISEGYGLNNSAIDYLKENDISLLITVDCGISNVAEVDYALEKDIDVIITDHHLPSETLPRAINVNPKLSTDENLHIYCGAMVALKLMCVLFDEEAYYENCDIAAIATIADMVDLKGENRQLVKMGLKKINDRENENIAYLVDECIKNRKQIKADDISFSIAPAINAAGRLDAADKCVELFTGRSQSPQETAAILAHDNYNRRKIEKETVDSALSKIKELDLTLNKAIILFDKSWHQGVLGIAASKIKNIYFRPVILFTENDGNLVGSARSVDGINIHEAIDYASEYVKQFGGHFMAAGLSVAPSEFNSFKEKIEESLLKYDKGLFLPKSIYDIKASTDEINMDFLEDIQKLEPFGKGNSAPVLYLDDIKLSNIQKMGSEEKHFRCKIDNSNTNINAVAFNNTNLYYENNIYDAIVSPQKNEWNGNTSIQAIIYNIKPHYDDNSWKETVGKLDKDFELSLMQGYYQGGKDIIKNKDLDFLIKNLESTPFSNIVLVVDEAAALALKNNLAKRFSTLNLSMINLNENKVNYNSLVIAPDFDIINLEDYKNIFIYTSFDITGMYKSLRSYDNVYIINEYKNSLDEKIISIKKLRDIFIFIKTAILKGEMNAYKYESGKIELWEVRAALKIFSEVGLIEYSIVDNKYILLDKKKTDIMQSDTFKNMQVGN